MKQITPGCNVPMSIGATKEWAGDVLAADNSNSEEG